MIIRTACLTAGIVLGTLTNPTHSSAQMGPAALKALALIGEDGAAINAIERVAGAGVLMETLERLGIRTGSEAAARQSLLSMNPADRGFAIVESDALSASFALHTHDPDAMTGNLNALRLNGNTLRKSLLNSGDSEFYRARLNERPAPFVDSSPTDDAADSASQSTIAQQRHITIEPNLNVTFAPPIRIPVCNTGGVSCSFEIKNFNIWHAARNTAVATGAATACYTTSCWEKLAGMTNILLHAGTPVPTSTSENPKP